MIDWLSDLWDHLTSVSLPLLILGIAFQTVQTCFVALAWRNILRVAYPKAGVTYKPILAYYAGGNGLNAILPASAGTIAMLGLFRASIPGSTAAGLVGATLVQSIFFMVMSGAIYLWLFIDAAGSFDVKFGWFHDHWFATLVIVVGGILLIALVVKIMWRKFQHQWENAKEGGAILAHKRLFLVEVVGVQMISYIGRMGVNATFMYAYDIPVSVTNVFLIVAASSISSVVAIAPGAVGAQTALANVVLKDVAPQAAITAYTIGQQLITTAWNVAFGLTLLARQIGWADTKQLLHYKENKKKQQEAEAAAAAAAAGTAATATPATPATGERAPPAPES